jgi:hypothetical protein
VIDFSNESYRLPEQLSDCNSNGYRHSFVELRKVLPERFDSSDTVHRWRGAAGAAVGEVGDIAADVAADIDGCRDRICVKGSISDEMTSINSLIHSSPFYARFCSGVRWTNGFSNV